MYFNKGCVFVGSVVLFNTFVFVMVFYDKAMY